MENFNLGAMENKGLNIFNILYLLTSPEITTDEEYIEIDNIIALNIFTIGLVIELVFKIGLILL